MFSINTERRQHEHNFLFGARKKSTVLRLGTETQFNIDKIVILTHIYSFKLQSHFLGSLHPRECLFKKSI